MAQAVNDHIRDTGQNVTEYCKREECWHRLKEKSFSLPKNIQGEYMVLRPSKVLGIRVEPVFSSSVERF